MGQVAIRVTGSRSRKLVQPFVLQYGRPAAWERRRRRRIAADRPVADAEVVLDIMAWLFGSFRLARLAGADLGYCRGRSSRRCCLDGPLERLGPGSRSGYSSPGTSRERIGLEPVDAAAGVAMMASERPFVKRSGRPPWRDSP
jgi:hypothetical protein